MLAPHPDRKTTIELLRLSFFHFITFHSEFEAEVQVEIELLGTVAVADGGSSGAEHRVVVVSQLSTVERLTLHQVIDFAGLLGTSSAEQDIAALAYLLLCLQLCGHELLVDILHAADTGEGHLLFRIVVEEVAANGVAEDRGNDTAEEQSSVEHRLEGEAAADGQRGTPVGTDVAHAVLLAQFLTVSIAVVELGEVVGDVGILGIEAAAARGEVPVVFVVKRHAGTVAEEVLVLQLHLLRPFGAELVAVVHEVPAESHLEVEVSKVEVQRR